MLAWPQASSMCGSIPSRTSFRCSRLQQQQWRDWRRFTASQRPFRALDKMWRAALEVVGLGKKHLLFEEAFAIRLLREMQPVIEQHPVVTAHRTPFVKPTLAPTARGSNC